MRELAGVGFISFAASKERAAFDILRELTGAVADIVKKFEGLVIAFSEGNMKKVQKLGEELDRLESEADGMRRKFECGLSKGAFLPVFRGDLGRLAEQVDDVADMAQEASRAIRWREELSKALARAEKKKAELRAIRKGLVDLAGISVKTVQALKESIDVMISNIDASILRAREIEKFEHESDLLEEKLIKLVYRHEKILDLGSMLQLKDIIEKIGKISDHAEDAGDIIMAISFMLRA